MAIFRKNGVLHNHPGLTAVAKARKEAKRNERKRRARAAKAERKAKNPAIAAAEKAAVKEKAKIKAADRENYGRGFWEKHARQANRWLNHQQTLPGKNGLSKDECIVFRAFFKRNSMSPWGGKALNRFGDERQEAMKKLAPGEKLWDWWRDGPNKTKVEKSGGGVALRVSGEEVAEIVREGEEMEEEEVELEEGEAEEEEAEFLGGAGARGGGVTLPPQLTDGRAMGMAAEKEEDDEDNSDDNDEE
ncbi:MAG: hypothetical protein Q9202_003083 [Teloschistes flavicans]